MVCWLEECLPNRCVYVQEPVPVCVCVCVCGLCRNRVFVDVLSQSHIELTQQLDEQREICTGETRDQPCEVRGLDGVMWAQAKDTTATRKWRRTQMEPALHRHEPRVLVSRLSKDTFLSLPFSQCVGICHSS
jgi:hypothetical protein